MRIENLVSPGRLANGIKLQTELAKAISSVEVTAMRTPGGKTQAAKQLSDCLASGVTALSGLFDVTAPTMAGITTAVASSATTIKLTFAEAMDTSVAPLPADLAVNNGGTVSGVAWGSGGDAGKLILTGTGYAAGDTVTYTKPAVNALRDLAGNQVATGTKVVS